MSAFDRWLVRILLTVALLAGFLYTAASVANFILWQRAVNTAVQELARQGGLLERQLKELERKVAAPAPAAPAKK